MNVFAVAAWPGTPLRIINQNKIPRDAIFIREGVFSPNDLRLFAVAQIPRAPFRRLDPCCNSDRSRVAQRSSRFFPALRAPRILRTAPLRLVPELDNMARVRDRNPAGIHERWWSIRFFDPWRA